MDVYTFKCPNKNPIHIEDRIKDEDWDEYFSGDFLTIAAFYKINKGMLFLFNRTASSPNKLAYSTN